MTSSPLNPPDPSRRMALKAMAVIAVGGCVALLGSGLLSHPKVDSLSQGQTIASELQDSTSGSGSQSAYTRVKVRYFQMSSTLPGVTQEYFVIKNPATYCELSDAVVAAHPALAPMMPGMLVLVDGVVATGGMPLQNGDEVDFIPAMAGG